MKIRRRLRVAALATVCASAVAGAAAQGPLAQLGLTEATARRLLLDEATAIAAARRSEQPESMSAGRWAESMREVRRSEIVEIGRKAFYKLPAAARGPATTALFAWAKSYVGSSAFKTAYAQRRRDVLGPDTPTALPPIDAEVQAQINEMRQNFAESRKIAASLPPASAVQLLKSIEEQEAKINSSEFEKLLRMGLSANRDERAERDAAAAKESDERYPADPTRIFARRLREFLDATADVNFSARTISLTGGPDGIEFLDKADRQRNWMWQEAVIAGPDATAAARAAADVWLKEIDR
jgi:hypothetical protein